MALDMSIIQFEEERTEVLSDLLINFRTLVDDMIRTVSEFDDQFQTLHDKIASFHKNTNVAQVYFMALE
jgi:hypothetical protein